MNDDEHYKMFKLETEMFVRDYVRDQVSPIREDVDKLVRNVDAIKHVAMGMGILYLLNTVGFIDLIKTLF